MKCEHWTLNLSLYGQNTQWIVIKYPPMRFQLFVLIHIYFNIISRLYINTDLQLNTNCETCLLPFISTIVYCLLIIRSVGRIIIRYQLFQRWRLFIYFITIHFKAIGIPFAHYMINWMQINTISIISTVKIKI